MKCRWCESRPTEQRSRLQHAVRKPKVRSSRERGSSGQVLGDQGRDAGGEPKRSRLTAPSIALSANPKSWAAGRGCGW